MFDAAGAEATRVLDLFWALLTGAAVIWLLLVGGTLYAFRSRRQHSEQVGRRLILFGGVLAPTVLLAVLAATSLSLMAELRSAEAAMSIRVTGEQFWWRVEYLADDGSVVLETANDFALPNRTAVELELVTADVIHSFWVPALAGKVDMIPGMHNRLLLEPQRTGTFRGQCAEFCGESHALMAFQVRVMEPAGYAAWLEHQQREAAPPEDAAERRGQSLFLGYGCGACHRVRGTAANGRLAPDLTHLAGRTRVAGETLANDPAALLAWLRHPEVVKPGVRMPSFAMLSEEELSAIVSYLRSLE
jgi:cytochrome c oxidase subunit 2